MSIELIFAMSQNRVIGNKNQLPWHIPADLKRFKQITLGHTIVMGRKTFDSIGRALPGRRNVVISRNPLFSAEGVEVYPSLGSALENLRGEKVFVIGGGQIFTDALPVADRIYMTVIEQDFEGDVFFPEFDTKQYTEVSAEACRHEDLHYTDYVLERRDS